MMTEIYVGRPKYNKKNQEKFRSKTIRGEDL